jgi:hypothetical protein
MITPFTFGPVQFLLFLKKKALKAGGEREKKRPFTCRADAAFSRMSNSYLTGK